LLGCPVIGIEYSPDLIKAARHNLRVCGIDDVEIVNGDAADFIDFGERVICFAYNPFDAEVFASVLSNLEASADVLFIYNNPVHAHLFAGWQVIHLKMPHHPNWRYMIFRRQQTREA
jgi:tRNA A58 N-methylase Trm61